jgi:hypothetical protein
MMTGHGPRQFWSSCPAWAFDSQVRDYENLWKTRKEWTQFMSKTTPCQAHQKITQIIGF